MLSKTIHERFCDQMNFEMYSANIYLSMASWFDAKNLKGFANWMKVQYQEEMLHATKFYDFLTARGVQAKIGAMPAPATEWKSPLAAFEDALEHEGKVTGRINDLVSLAIGEKDHASVNFLQFFVAEQVEEESNVEGIIQQLKLAEGAAGAVMLLDRELAARVFTPPAPGAA